MELEPVVVGFALRLQLPCHGQCITVDFQPVLDFEHVARRVEVGRVGKQEAQRIADPAVGFDDALENLVGDRQLARVVGSRHPQTENIGAERVGNLLRGNHVALGLRHLQALAVDHEAVRQQCLVWGTAVHGAADQQGALEPAAMLVRTFEIEIGRIRQFVAVRAAQDACVCGARVEPDVERVAHLAVVLGIGAE